MQMDGSTAQIALGDNMDIRETALRAKKAAMRLAAEPSESKNIAISDMAAALRRHMAEIVAANQADLKRAETEGLSAPLLKRLKFDAQKIDETCEGLNSLVGLKDPVGVTLQATELDQDLALFKVSCPIGVVGVVFESRPDALVQISSLCLKSGNAVLLKGGSEATETNQTLARILSDATRQAGIADNWMNLLETRADVASMLDLDDAIDLIIPRGSNEFVRHIMENTHIPVLGHADGICHVYIDREADVDMAVRISVDSKCQYVAVCNAAETLLVHEQVAEGLLPDIQAALEEKGVELRGCEKTLGIIKVKPATEKDWQTEYLDLVLAVKIVDSLESAIDHINRFGSGHTDVIVTANQARAAMFMDFVDSAGVFWNCSSRFSDGFRYGLGAEVGISTNKIHARGPVGLEGLVIYKWRLHGNGHIVADYTGADAKPFSHRRLAKPLG